MTIKKSLYAVALLGFMGVATSNAMKFPWSKNNQPTPEYTTRNTKIALGLKVNSFFWPNYVPCVEYRIANTKLSCTMPVDSNKFPQIRPTIKDVGGSETLFIEFKEKVDDKIITCRVFQDYFENNDGITATIRQGKKDIKVTDDAKAKEIFEDFVNRMPSDISEKIAVRKAEWNEVKRPLADKEWARIKGWMANERETPL